MGSEFEITQIQYLFWGCLSSNRDPVSFMEGGGRMKGKEERERWDCPLSSIYLVSFTHIPKGSREKKQSKSASAASSWSKMRQFTLSFLHQDPWENPVLPLGTALSTTVKTVTCYPLLRDLPLSLNERWANPLRNSAKQNQKDQFNCWRFGTYSYLVWLEGLWSTAEASL